MAFIAPIAAAVGGSTLATAGAVVGAAGSVLQGVARHRQLQFQEQVLKNQAEYQEQLAMRENLRGQVEQQEQDFDALRQMGANEVSRAGSGFELSSPGFNRARRRESVLARRDALRIRADSDARVRGFENEAATLRTEAGSTALARRNNIASTTLNVGSSLISGADMINRSTARRLRREAAVG